MKYLCANVFLLAATDDLLHMEYEYNTNYENDFLFSLVFLLQIRTLCVEVYTTAIAHFSFDYETQPPN